MYKSYREGRLSLIRMEASLSLFYIFSIYKSYREGRLSLTEWRLLSTVAAEIDKFAPVLLSDEGAAPAPTLAQAGARRQMKLGETGNASENPSWLAARARWMASAAVGPLQGGDDYYLFVANDGNGRGKVRFTLDRSVTAIAAEGVQVVSESPPRKIDFDGSGTSGAMSFRGLGGFGTTATWSTALWAASATPTWFSWQGSKDPK